MCFPSNVSGQTERQTDTLIAILRFPTADRVVIISAVLYRAAPLLSAIGASDRVREKHDAIVGERRAGPSARLARDFDRTMMLINRCIHMEIRTSWKRPVRQPSRHYTSTRQHSMKIGQQAFCLHKRWWWLLSTAQYVLTFIYSLDVRCLFYSCSLTVRNQRICYVILWWKMMMMMMMMTKPKTILSLSSTFRLPLCDCPLTQTAAVWRQYTHTH